MIVQEKNRFNGRLSSCRRSSPRVLVDGATKSIPIVCPHRQVEFSPQEGRDVGSIATRVVYQCRDRILTTGLCHNEPACTPNLLLQCIFVFKRHLVVSGKSAARNWECLPQDPIMWGR